MAQSGLPHLAAAIGMHSVPGVGNAPEGDSLKGNHRGCFSSSFFFQGHSMSHSLPIETASPCGMCFFFLRRLLDSFRWGIRGGLFVGDTWLTRVFFSVPTKT